MTDSSESGEPAKCLLSLPTDALAAIAAKLLASGGPAYLAHLFATVKALQPISREVAIEAARTQWGLQDMHSLEEYVACARIIGQQPPAIEFNESRYTLVDGSCERLDEVMHLLLRHGRAVTVYLEGHVATSEPDGFDVAAGRCRVVAAALLARGADPTRLHLRSWAKRVDAAESVCGSRVEIFFAAGETTPRDVEGALLYPSRARYERLEAARGSAACSSVPVDDEVYDLVAQELKERPDIAAQGAVGWRSDIRGGVGSGSDVSPAARHHVELWDAAVERLEDAWHPAQRHVS